MDPASRRLFFTGTDTDVGKTYVASLMVRELRQRGRCVGVYKPVASGCRACEQGLHSDDAAALWEASGRRGALASVCPQRFLAPLAPPAAAAEEGRAVDETLLVSGIEAVSEGADWLVIEGAGGLLSPLSQTQLNSDVATKLSAELVIVAANRLGAIHQVLATVLAAKALGLPVLGIVLNQVSPQGDASTASNAATIGRFTSVPVLAEIGWSAAATGVDWMALDRVKKSDLPIPQAWL